MCYQVFILLTLIKAGFVLSAECSYEGNICDADAQCMGEISNGYGCFDMTHEKLYESSSPRKFSIHISDKTTYPEDVSITVLRLYKNEYTTVRECCNLRSNESCVLPPTNGDKYVIVAPVLQKEIHFLVPPPFCSHEVLVYDKDDQPLKWCFFVQTAPCKYVEGVVVYVNESHREVSTHSYQKNLTYDLCLFDAPIMKADGFRYFQEDGLSYGVKNVEGDPDEICDGKRGGKILKNLNRRKYLDAFKERAPPGYTRCGFEKEIGFSSRPTWSLKPICHANGTPEPFPVWSIAMIVTVIALVLLFIIVMVYRRYANFWFPNFKISLRTEVFSNDAENGEDEKTKRESKANKGTKQKVDNTKEGRYVKMPASSSKSPFQTTTDNLPMIDTVWTVSSDNETSDNITSKSNASSRITHSNSSSGHAEKFENTNFEYINGEIIPTKATYLKL